MNTVRYVCDAPSLTPPRYNFLQLQVQSLITSLLEVILVILHPKTLTEILRLALCLQLMGVLPILPLLFPVMWVLVNAFGEARVLAEFSRVSPSGLVGDGYTHE